MKKFNLMIILLAVLIIPLKVNARSDTITVTLNKCVDGDTAWFNYKEDVIKVRFLAINTMELKSEDENANLAKDYTCNSLTNAKEIKLEFDSKSDEKDKYERYLTWVFVDDVLLQKELIKKGYAEIKYIYGEYKYVEELKKEEEIAKNNNLGIWKDSKKEASTKNQKYIKNNNYPEYIYIIIGIVCFFLGISTNKIKKIIKILKK